MELRPYQEDGVYYLTIKDRALLGDEMGLGKTPQACVALGDRLLPGQKALIICPASLKINWYRELRQWAPHLSVDIAAGDYFPDDQVVIINYNILKRHHKAIRRFRYHIGICDEAHYMKTLDSTRTKEIRGGWGTSPIQFDVKWALTGTPLINRTMELYPILKWLDVKWSTTEEGFGIQYCAGYRDRHGWRFHGSSNRPLLKQNLKSVMLRRKKKDVLTDLPAKTRQIIELEYNAAGKAAVAEEWTALEHLHPGKTYDEIAFMMRSPDIAEMSFDKIAGLRKKTALTKLDACADHIKGLLSTVPKIVVFGYHTDMIAGIVKRLKGVDLVTLTGSTSPKKRQEAVDRFQNDPACSVFLGNVEAAGVGITLTAASLSIFIEEDWRPGMIEQAEDRIHRFGQKWAVLCQHLILNGSIDAYMLQAQVGKQNLINDIIN